MTIIRKTRKMQLINKLGTAFFRKVSVIRGSSGVYDLEEHSQSHMNREHNINIYGHIIQRKQIHS